MMEFEVRDVDYPEYTNRQLAFVPLAVLVVALLILVGWWAMTGAPVALGIDFTGGSELTVESSLSQSEIRTEFGESLTSVQGVVGSDNTYVLRFQSSDTQSLRDQARATDMNVLSSSSTPASFGAGSQRTALVGLLVAFGGMALLVFGLFRTFVPSLAVVVSAFSDIVIPLAVMNVFTAIPFLPDIKLSLGTVAALLMLIGYSVDSDILLNNHVLRRSGGFYESVYRAMDTGVTMTLTSISAMAVMAVVASLFGIELMASIGLILVIGLAADLMNTYLLNLSLLRWYKYEGVKR